MLGHKFLRKKIAIYFLERKKDSVKKTILYILIYIYARNYIRHFGRRESESLNSVSKISPQIKSIAKTPN